MEEEGQGPGFVSLDSSRKTCTKLLDRWLDNLHIIWEEVGIPNDQKIHRVKVVHDNLAELMKAMIEEETARRDEYIDCIGKSRQECIRLCEELEREHEEPADDLTVIRQEKALRNQVKQLMKERQIRVREASNLRSLEGDLCHRVGRIPEYIPSDTVLSTEQIKEANTRIGFLTAEKNKREIKLAKAAEDILLLWSELNIRSRNDREEIIEKGDLESFQLSNENMAWLEQMKQTLSFQLEENKKLRKAMSGKMESLWSRMELPEADQKKFLSQYTGYSDFVIVKFKEEVHRLEALKLQNLEKFIRLTREEIEKHWELMFYCEEERKSFQAYWSETIGENLLAEHEKKLECLREEYENYENLYKTMRTRGAMWDKWERMELQESDPNRFDNRGGKLLKEEKERKRIARELPKYEDTIIKEIASWEQDTGKNFTVMGRTFSDYVNHQKEELSKKKEEMKENKLKAKEVTMQNDLTYGSTPARTPKRRIAGTTILTPANKKAKAGPSTPVAVTPTRGRTPRGARFVHSSLAAKSPIRMTPSREKNFPRVVVKIPSATKKRPDTPVKKTPMEEVVQEAESRATPFPPSESSMDSGCVSNLDMENPVADYSEFVNEVNQPSRELMRSSSVHTPNPASVRRSLLNTIEEC